MLTVAWHAMCQAIFFFPCRCIREVIQPVLLCNRAYITWQYRLYCLATDLLRKHAKAPVRAEKEAGDRSSGIQKTVLLTCSPAKEKVTGEGRQENRNPPNGQKKKRRMKKMKKKRNCLQITIRMLNFAAEWWRGFGKLLFHFRS